jgi:uncharacterized 2Fe-2S/4Fe-4S cluster protein (DUF4445 family)
LYFNSLSRSDGVRLACCIVAEADLHITIEHPMPPIAWRPLREDEYSEFSLPPSLQLQHFQYGVAIDLGTTHLQLTLWDLKAGRRVAGLVCLNPQGSYGADILTRLMEVVRGKEIADEMRCLVQQIIDEALSEIAEKKQN